ncbi:YchJ family protein [Bermanella sp. WJH001]|uniref:YchJ family protein n=1 Tax=Bermanella sp. WJH001 TaxID=3048005 RepID=UPI0024BE4CC1|nr:YchJ family protein [Bermanella sp. WJH001]MDJ1539687.1 YchJ family protein [Bermanella sp. WJH001]
MICPCQQQQPNARSYQQCCEPFHKGEIPATAEQLMRSRFSGYVLGLSQYVRDTWHISTRPNDLNLSPDNNWLKLDIVKTNTDQVHFCAFFKDENEFAVLEEISNFVFEHGRWFYVDGKTDTHTIELGRNDVCLCGSSKKYKKCCQR